MISQASVAVCRLADAIRRGVKVKHFGIGWEKNEEVEEGWHWKTEIASRGMP